MIRGISTSKLHLKHSRCANSEGHQWLDEIYLYKFLLATHPENQQLKQTHVDHTGLRQVEQVYCMTDFSCKNFAFPDVVQVMKSKFGSIIGGVWN